MKKLKRKKIIENENKIEFIWKKGEINRIQKKEKWSLREKICKYEKSLYKMYTIKNKYHKWNRSGRRIKRIENNEKKNQKEKKNWKKKT